MRATDQKSRYPDIALVWKDGVHALVCRRDIISDASGGSNSEGAKEDPSKNAGWIVVDLEIELKNCIFRNGKNLNAFGWVAAFEAFQQLSHMGHHRLLRIRST